MDSKYHLGDQFPKRMISIRVSSGSVKYSWLPTFPRFFGATSSHRDAHTRHFPIDRAVVSARQSQQPIPLLSRWSSPQLILQMGLEAGQLDGMDTDWIRPR